MNNSVIDENVSLLCSKNSTKNKRNENLDNLNEKQTSKSSQLSIFFATLCVIDLFGVFPIVALPSAIISCGLYGIPLTLFVISLQIYTAVILGKCWIIAEKLLPSIITKNRYPYAAIAEFTYGKHMSLFVTILLDVTVFGGGIPNLLVASQNLELLGFRITDGKFNFSFCYWLIIIGILLCPIMWLGSPKNMKVLATISVFTVSSAAILTWYCIIDDDKKFDNIQNITASNGTIDDIVEYIKKTQYPSFSNLLQAYGIIAFQFDIHPMLLTIQVDMHNKKGIGKSVCFGILFTITISAITTIFIVLKYGTNITPNILESLPRSWSLYLTISLVTLQLCLSSAVGSSALFQHIEDVFETSRNFTYKRCIIRSVLVFLAIIIGELLPRFDLVMGLIGGTLTGPLIFILPPLFYTKITRLEEIYDDEAETLKQNQLEIEQIYENDNILIKSYGSIPITDNNLNKNQFTFNGILQEFLNKFLMILRFICSDCIISILVVAFGLAATFVSTYCNLFDISVLVQWSPCLSNSTFDLLNL